MTTQLLVGGMVYSSPAVPDATAFAITDGVVVWVGTDDVGRALHPDAEVIDLEGHFVAPAFVDSHVHLTDMGLRLTGLDLTDATSRTDCLDRLAAHVADSDQAIVWGLGWDASTWSGDQPDDDMPPTTADIDRVAGGRPVYLARVDEHSAAASSALRELVHGIEAVTGFDAQGPLVADAHHRVRAAARALITPEARHDAQIKALDHAAARGVVAVHENGGPDISGVDDFRSLADLEHGVTVRRYWGQPVSTLEEARAVVSAMGADGIGGDLFVDGALGSRTAWLSTEYSDAPGEFGVSYLDEESVANHLRATTLAGVQAGFHVIGDGAVAAVAAAMTLVADELGTPALARCAHRLEHAEMVTTEQAEVFARCGVVASMQPLFDDEWGGDDALYVKRLGDRAPTLNNFAGLAKAGVALAFSSDAPVCDIDPWATIRAAAHHHTPTNAISPRAAFAACTRGGWRAGGINDGLTGTLVPGAPAHYAVWDVDELVVAASHAGVQRWSTDPRSRVPALPDVAPGARLPECVRTVAAGVTIYERPTA
ncbi:amidohydrolase [Gordonia sp. PDNC005]|uniref:amidohydrolase n=1 Tax=unclassified Gordonia (in: high G+C Gram-positive bacteria) TaxID=2657482 RepID=UPI0019653B0B|nr:amidohydrolase [Gordonia sp. PDNC005]QRY64161.1 amidohydrolase [Gordonia sp. PDNC005]